MGYFTSVQQDRFLSLHQGSATGQPPKKKIPPSTHIGQALEPTMGDDQAQPAHLLPPPACLLHLLLPQRCAVH